MTTTASGGRRAVGGADQHPGTSPLRDPAALPAQLTPRSSTPRPSKGHQRGVMGAVPRQGNRYRIIIAGAVQTVCQRDPHAARWPMMGNQSRPTTSKRRRAAVALPGKVAWLDSFFEFLVDSFRPILGDCSCLAVHHVHVVD